MAQKLSNESCFFVIFVFLKHFTHYRLFFNSVANTFSTTLGNSVFFFSTGKLFCWYQQKKYDLGRKLRLPHFQKENKSMMTGIKLDDKRYNQ